jgi:hypothetical protein
MIIEHKIMETEEYKRLYNEVKAEHPNEYDYFIHLYCLRYMNIYHSSNILKSDIIIDEVQKSNTPE